MRRRNLKCAKWAAMAGLALALGPLAKATTTYTYTGQPFNQFYPPGVVSPYSTSDFIQVTFTTVTALPASLPFPTILTPVGSPPVMGTLPVEVSIQMTDGGNGPSVDPMGTVGCGTTSTVCSGILVGTDANGAINQWVMVSVTCPSGGCTTSPTSGLLTEFGTENFTQGGVTVGFDYAVRCGTTVTACGPATTTGDVALAVNENSFGTWSMATTQGSEPAVTVALLTSSPAVFGQPVALSVKVVQPETSTPVPGTVQLVVGGEPCGGITPCGVITLNQSGTATINLPDPKNNIPDPSMILPVGGNSIQAQYNPPVDSSYLASASAPINLNVVPSIAVSPNPAVYGQALTFSSTVDNPPFTTNITSVIFTWDDSPQSPREQVSNGQAQFAPPLPLSVGNHYVEADAYSSSAATGFVAASNTLPFVIGKANTTTGLTFSQTGATATFLARVGVVAPGAGNPTGTVTFKNGSTTLTTAPLTSGAAMFSASNITGTITAVYSGDTNFNSSMSPGVTVNPPQSPVARVSISSSPNPSQLGQAVTFSASVTVVSGTGNPTGSVQFLDGGTSLGSVSLSGGSASITTSSLSVGSHAIVAQYSGDSVFSASSASEGQVVNRLASTLSLTSSAAQVNAGQSVTLTAKVSTAASGTPAPTGQVTFSGGGKSLGAVALSGNSASVTASNLNAGTLQFTASYSGDANYAASNASVTVTVAVAPVTITTTTLAGGTVGVPYSASVAAIGGTGSYTFTIGGLPPGVKADSTTGAITGTPTDGGSFTVSVQVKDSKGTTAATTLTLNIAIPPLTITATLPDGKQGSNYSGSASAAGGVPPLKLTITGLPPGLTASISGASATVSGQPKTAGAFAVTVQVTDSKGTPASKSFTVNIASTAVTIAPATGSGVAGQPFSQCVTVTGGTPPYTYSATLPAGLTIDPMTGCISGTPTVGGTVTITVTVTDSTGAKNTVTFTVTFALPVVNPTLNFTGLGNAADPRTQPGFGVALTGPYPVDIQGTLTLTFHPAGGTDTGEVTFATGGRTIPFTIPANSTAGVFTIPTVALQTGTVAGSITVTATLKAGDVDVTPAPAPSKQIQVNPGPPVIVNAQATRNATGFTVTINGFTSTREMTQAVFAFNPAAGANLQTTSLTISVGSLFAPWLQGTQVIGSQFLFTQPFTVTGNLQAVTSITVTLMNSQGSSNMVTATVQ